MLIELVMALFTGKGGMFASHLERFDLLMALVTGGLFSVKRILLGIGGRDGKQK